MGLEWLPNGLYFIWVYAFFRLPFANKTLAAYKDDILKISWELHNISLKMLFPPIKSWYVQTISKSKKSWENHNNIRKNNMKKNLEKKVFNATWYF